MIRRSARRQAGDRLVAELGRRSDLGRPGEGLEAVESLAGTPAQAVRAGPVEVGLPELLDRPEFGPPGLVALAAQRNDGQGGADGDDQQEESDQSPQRRQGRLAPAPPPGAFHAVTGRARIGSPARNRRRSSASASAPA